MLSCVWFFVTPWTAACQAPLSFTISQSLLKPMSIEVVMLSNHLILCRSLLLPSIFPSIRVFSSELALCIRWPEYWSFSFSIGSSSEYSGLISFRIDLSELFAVQGTLKSLLQHHNTKASILWCLTFFVIQLSHPYISTVKTTALTAQTFVGKMGSLLFNMVSRLVIVFHPMSKYLSISWLLSPSTVTSESRRIKSVTASTFPPSTCREVMGLDVNILVSLMSSFKSAFSLSSFTLIKRLFSYSSLSAVRAESALTYLTHPHIWGFWYFSWQSWF